MISTTMSGSSWVLISTTRSNAGLARTDSVDSYWNGSSWATDPQQAKSFATQRDALDYRDGHLQELESPEE